jgi:hypothetical protein
MLRNSTEQNRVHVAVAVAMMSTKLGSQLERKITSMPAKYIVVPHQSQTDGRTTPGNLR